MPGGLLQLVAYGAQNIYLNGNPSLSFFKKIYKTHTNFASESMRLNFNRTSINCTDKTMLICKIDRNADMLQNMYFSFTIPNIRKKIDNKFKFVNNLGEAIIDNYYITIGGNIVDKQYGEWLHIWNELSLTSEKTFGYSKLIGNVADIFAPDDFSRKYTQNDEIQIFERKIYVPLLFWFNKLPGLALPLISLQYHQIEVHIELRPLVDVFTVGISPSYNRQSKTAIGGTTVKPTAQDCEYYFGDSSAVNMDPYIEANYIFLDTNERKYFATKSQEYLIEQVNRITYDGLAQNTMITLDVHNPVKEFIWILARNDRNLENRWFEFTDWDTIKNNRLTLPKITDTQSYTESSVNGEIMKSAKLLFNGLDRMEQKDNYYYNIIQPYQHHTFIPKTGIYVYSFSLHPENFQPSGSCNMSQINKVQMYIEAIEPNNALYKYDMTLYSINYNFLKITSGLGGLAFA
jgi:hypothetical protein